MRVVTAPEPLEQADLFLAGGISNCPQWQQDAVTLLSDLPGTVLNPRRGTDFNDEEAEQQIEWEHEALSTVPKIVFWFPQETLCPITLFELGVFSQRPHVDMFVGTHPNYGRRLDVVKQLQLARPEITVHDNLNDTIQNYIRSIRK